MKSLIHYSINAPHAYRHPHAPSDHLSSNFIHKKFPTTPYQPQTKYSILMRLQQYVLPLVAALATLTAAHLLVHATENTALKPRGVGSDIKGMFDSFIKPIFEKRTWDGTCSG